MVYWLNDFEINFPHPDHAAPDGLLAVGGDLRPERMLLAYRHGIFPWFEENGAFGWFSPDPRFVVFPGELRVHKSVRSIFNQKKFEFTLDTDFRQVIEQCARVPRPGQIGSWLTERFVDAYVHLFDLGLAHSVEVRQAGRLVGGLYGVSLGKVFFGESMFSEVPNASKAGFITLARALNAADFWMIDCQVETDYLGSLGARNISRGEFLEVLARNRFESSALGRWAFDGELGIKFPKMIDGQ